MSMRPKKLEQLFNISIDERSPIVFYCMAGIRSMKAAAIAQKLGFLNVKNYGGGWNDWAEHQRN